MARLYLDEADFFDADLRRLAASESSRRAARLRRYLEDLSDEIEGASLRSLPLPHRGDRHAIARWQGEITEGHHGAEPKPVYIEVQDPSAPACPTRLQRDVSSAVTCLLGLVRRHEAEIVRLRSKLRKQRRGADRLEKRVEALERPAPGAALVPAPAPPVQPATAVADRNRIAAVVAAVAAVPLFELTLLSPLTHGDGVLVQLSGHLMAIGLAVVVFYLVERFLGGTSFAGGSPARENPTARS